ncbi:hypothetical protein Tsubulata_001110 [Turnera subulata]|uniref:DUF4283 domain-containing protein n=1 Tax=Turnera subulata TaxID=218843 RepID=A0A9Q0JGK4_9ROSI|nr:hypothetical protein Tsubulata_001110 [Turnera subulata]
MEDKAHEMEEADRSTKKVRIRKQPEPNSKPIQVSPTPTPTVRLMMEIEDRRRSSRNAFAKRWELAVVVKVMGRSVSYQVISEKLRSMWLPNGHMKVIDLDNDFFLVRFTDRQDYLRCLTQGPWTVFGAALCVQSWTTGFNATTGKITKAVVWVQFPELCPFRTGDRVKFVRIAVEVDLENPLRGRIMVEGIERKVVYESLPLVCYHCGKVSYALFSCPFKESSQADKEQGAQATPELKGKEQEKELAQVALNRSRNLVVG